MPDRFGLIDFDEFHTAVLLARLAAGNGALAVPALGGLDPIAFRLPDGRSYTLAPAPAGLTVTAGDDGARTVVELSPDDWSVFVWELRSAFGLFYGDRLTIVRGGFGQLAAWEPALRAAFDAQPIFDVADPPIVDDGNGRPLDLATSFTLDDPDEVLRDFLERAGFLHLRGVLDDDEVDAVRADVDAALATAHPDDKRSWWTVVDGVDVCNRVNYVPDGAGIGADARFARIGALGGPDQRDAPDRLDGNTVVIKVPGASSGLADLPWHRDCGMGGHSVKCPMLNIGIQLDAATPDAGQLHMLAGSHRGTSRLPGRGEADGPNRVALTTAPGDVTIHFGHTLHAAPPPVRRDGAGRRALYLTYVPPVTFAMVSPGQGYKDVLFTRGSGHVPHVAEIARG